VSRRRPVLARMARQKTRRPQLVRIALILALSPRQRHQPGLGLRRNRWLLARSGAVIKAPSTVHRPAPASMQRWTVYDARPPLTTAKKDGLRDKPASIAHAAPGSPASVRDRENARSNAQRPPLSIRHLKRSPPRCQMSLLVQISQTRNPPTYFQFHRCWPIDAAFHGIGRLVPKDHPQSLAFSARVAQLRQAIEGSPAE